MVTKTKTAAAETMTLQPLPALLPAVAGIGAHRAGQDVQTLQAAAVQAPGAKAAG